LHLMHIANTGLSTTILIVAQGKPQLPTVIKHLLSISAYTKILVVELSENQAFTNGCSKKRGALNILQIPFYSHEFNKAKTLNLGISLCLTRQVIVCDADVLLSKDILQRWLHSQSKKPFCEVLDQVKESSSGMVRHAPGIITFPKVLAEAIGGYFSGYSGWGCEDLDFLHRLENLCGVGRHGIGVHLTHGDEERVRYYNESSLPAMRAYNHKLLRQRINSMAPLGSMTNDLSWWHSNYNNRMQWRDEN
jgi:predicted glycosyltransferase involved in capsule biosynthesis